MGIRSAFSNLQKLLYNPNTVNLGNLNGKTILIDFQGLLHRMIRENITNPKEYVLQIINFIEKLETYNITPIFVIEGKPHSSKTKKSINIRKKAEEKLKQYSITTDVDITDTSFNLLKKSIKIDKQIVDNCKKLFNNLNCMYIHNINNEADHTIAYISQKYNMMIYSEDFDMLLYTGISYVLKSLDYINDTFKVYSKVDILTTLDISPNQLIDIAFLSGTDYNCKLYKSSFITNLNYIKLYGNVTTFIAKLFEINGDRLDGNKIILPKYNFDYNLIKKIFTLATITVKDKTDIDQQLDYYYKKKSENKNTLSNLFKIKTILEELNEFYCLKVKNKYINKLLSYSKQHFGFYINIDYYNDY